MAGNECTGKGWGLQGQHATRMPKASLRNKPESPQPSQRIVAPTDHRATKQPHFQVFLVLVPSGPTSHVSKNSVCRLALPSDASDEQNSQSSVENSANGSEKAERQPSGEAALAAETPSISQVPRARPQRGGQVDRAPVRVPGVC